MPRDPAQEAARLDAEADALEARARELRREALAALSQAYVWRRAARLLRTTSTEKRLPSTLANMSTSTMSDASRMRLSDARTKAPADAPMTTAMRAHGYTLRSLARTLDVSAAHLSLIRAGKKKPSPALAARIRDLLGWCPEAAGPRGKH